MGPTGTQERNQAPKPQNSPWRAPPPPKKALLGDSVPVTESNYGALVGTPATERRQRKTNAFPSAVPHPPSTAAPRDIGHGIVGHPQFCRGKRAKPVPDSPLEGPQVSFFSVLPTWRSVSLVPLTINFSLAPQLRQHKRKRNPSGKLDDSHLLWQDGHNHSSDGSPSLYPQRNPRDARNCNSSQGSQMARPRS